MGADHEVKTPGILHEIGRNLGIQYKEGRAWNVKFGQIVSLVSHIYTEKLNSAYLNFVKTAVNEYVYTGPDGAKMLSSQLYLLNDSRFSGYWGLFSHNEMIEIMRNLMREPEKNIKNDIVEDYSVFASKDRWSADNLGAINEALDEEIKQKTDLHKIKRLLIAYGMFANNEQELTDILSKPTPTLKTDSRYELETRLKEYLLTYYMRNNQPIKNLYSVLFATRLDRVPIFRDNFASELADYIETNNLMPNDFQNIYDL